MPVDEEEVWVVDLVVVRVAVAVAVSVLKVVWATTIANGDDANMAATTAVYESNPLMVPDFANFPLLLRSAAAATTTAAYAAVAPESGFAVVCYQPELGRPCMLRRRT